MSRKHQFARRSFLRGVGTTLALPLLDSLQLKSILHAADVAASPVRMAFLYVPNGVIPTEWTPADTGDNFKLTRTLEPLDELRSEVLILSGLAQDNGRAKGDGSGDHAREASTFLTGAHPFKTAGTNIRAGISADQIAATQIGSLTKLPSLELGIDPGGNAGNCDSGYSCAYSSNISWRTPNMPVSKEIHPKLVFERMFGNPQMNLKVQARRDYLRKSVLDLVQDDAQKLVKELGQTDRRKIDEYFSGVRDLERRIEASMKSGERKPAPTNVTIPTGIPVEFEDHAHLMLDLLALAFQADVTRTATFMFGNSGGNRIYHEIGVNDGHHYLSHHKGKAELIEQIASIDRYLMTHYAYFLNKLRSIKEGEGTLLDNCMILYGSALSDGNAHEHSDLPILLGGRGGDTIKTGRHLKLPEETPLNNLLVSLLDRVGVSIDQFGDSTGRIAGLEG